MTPSPKFEKKQAVAQFEENILKKHETTDNMFGKMPTNLWGYA